MSTSWDVHPGVRTGGRLRPGERAADRAGRVLGSGSHLAAVTSVALLVAVTVLVRDGRAPAVADLVAALCVLIVVELAAVLLAARRAERIAAELALFHLDQSRRAGAVAEELRAELQLLRADLARVVAATDINARPRLKR
ncbi:hypothetical protein [Actinoplanes sp. NPDC049265]|uniref:hypothetical protein n=1 Tax=Actinoplanes sp. NPDC049265 TaxID=3363902 RepID=UPI00371B2FCE